MFIQEDASYLTINARINSGVIIRKQGATHILSGVENNVDIVGLNSHLNDELNGFPCGNTPTANSINCMPDNSISGAKLTSGNTIESLRYRK